MRLDRWRQRWETRRESRRPLPRQTGWAIPVRRWQMHLVWVGFLAVAFLTGNGVLYLASTAVVWTASGLLVVWARRRGWERPSP